LKYFEKVSPVFDGKKYPIPPPTYCPECRLIIRMAWKNERKLYKRTCDLCNADVISIYSIDKSYKTYCLDCWWGDKWDPLEYGRDFDPDRSFFEQFKELIEVVPKQTRHQNNNYENCKYTTSTTRNRNVYMISSAGYNEDCYYGIYLVRNKNSVDNTHLMDSELCFECIDVDNGYNQVFCQNTKTCNDCAFLYDCHGCSNCFMCFGLRSKEYYIRNKQYSKEDYESEMKKIDLSSHETMEKLKEEYQDFIVDCPRLFIEGQNNENVTASNHIFNSKNCKYCFDCNNLEDCKYCGWFNDSKDSYDIYSFGYPNIEESYNSMEIGAPASRILMCMHTWDSIANFTYCLACHTSEHLFGCAALKRSKYCILNKQYTQEEYEALSSKIVERMQADGEWGLFFPLEFCHFGYNETVAQDFFPITKEDAVSKGWKWHDEVEETPDVEKIIPADQLPDKTADIPDDVTNWAIKCSATNKPFILQKMELEFYRRMNIPIPRLHPDERHRLRFARRNPRRIFDRKCDKCQKEIQTTYAPERPERVFCEECYLEEVY